MNLLLGFLSALLVLMNGSKGFSFSNFQPYLATTIYNSKNPAPCSEAGFRISLSNCLMLACDIPLCLSGKVKIKTVKVECVVQHLVLFLVDSLWKVSYVSFFLSVVAKTLRKASAWCASKFPFVYCFAISDGKSNTFFIYNKHFVSFFT